MRTNTEALRLTVLTFIVAALILAFVVGVLTLATSGRGDSGYCDAHPNNSSACK